MSKFSAEELSSRINDLELDDDVKISLMEDITDSVSPDESEELSSLKEEIQKKDAEIEELKEKYKERFLKAAEEKEDAKEEKEELEEKEIIDIKEI